MSETLTLSLISHTNVGKTTLARTLLRRDVGEVLDQAHVTDESEEFVLLEAPEGRIVLWDTPGFGDSVRLLGRLRAQANPLGWLVSQLWDRFADRPLWCSQQAVKNVREEADVVLYLVSAAEDPDAAGYVPVEMEILGWIDRPVLVVLNQAGPPRPAGERAATEERWRRHLAAIPVVRDVLTLDAFSRGWIEEGVLLTRLLPIVPAARRPLLDILITRWRRERLDVLAASVGQLATLLSTAASDSQPLDGLWDRIGSGAVGALGSRLARTTREATRALVTLHGLTGESAAEIQTRLEDVSRPDEPPDPWTTGLLGGLAGGAFGGLAADLATGGLSFGGGMLAGAVLGAIGVGGATWSYQLLGGETERPCAAWSEEFLDRQARDACLRYLAVAHFGRGQGEFRERAHAAFWQDAVSGELESRRGALHRVWDLAHAGRPEDARRTLEPLLGETLRAVLLRCHPEGEALLSGAS